MFVKINKMNKTISRNLKVFLVLVCLCAHTVVSLRLNSHSLRAESHLAFKDNLEVQNWYYGNLSPLDYRLKIFKVAANETTTTCPITAPFMTADMSAC